MKIMKKSFLDNITVAKKSFLLLLVSSLGLLFLGVIVYLGLFNIRQEVNRLYIHEVENITLLHQLRNHCNSNLQNLISNPNDISHTIGDLHKRTHKLTQTYKRLQDLSPQAANRLSRDITALRTLLSQADQTLKQQNQQQFITQIVPQIQSRLLHCNQTAGTLIAQNLKSMRESKYAIEEHYYGTLVSTFLLIIAILVFSVILAYSIFTNIKKLIFGLSDIVAKKTREYQELALQMEYKVNKEVIKNREKDQIMYQHARLAAMGEMIGNIAHQWRQPLNALTVLIQSFGIKSMSGNLTQEFIDQQVREGLRLANQMSNTIEDFKNFFSPHKEREYFGVVESIRETLDLVELFLKDEHIDIQLIAKEEIRVYGYSNEFSQVILNLLNNARDNFKQRNIQSDRRIVIKVERKRRPEPFVMISFIDNGGGVDPHIIDRIFEPYFTTKHKSTGTGIGLYMSKQIIEKQMQGLVTMKNINSKMGTDKTYRCAQFIIAIPIK